MRFTLDSSHNDFGASIDSLLSKADTPAVARAWTSGDTEAGVKLWHRLAETGVAGLLISEEHGGLGADPIDMVVAVEQLGRHAVPGPVVETVAVAPALLTATAPERLEAVAEGAFVTVAAPPSVPLAADATVADLALILDGDTVSTATAEAGKPSVDPTRTCSRLTAADALGSTDGARALNLGALATAAQLQGLGARMLEISVEYAKSRKQFGVPIGSQQAIKHQLAEVSVGLEMARPLLLAAALSATEGSDTARRDASAAKVACGDAAYRAARVALQVHGAIGYTQEYDLSLWLTKTRALLTAWGTPAEHRSRVMEAL